jgi:hypothetical protein
MDMQIEVAEAHHGSAETDRCPNCNAPRGGEYCHHCGQKRTHPDHYTVKHFLNNILREVSDLDSKLFKTFAALLFRPGYLTTEYLAERKERYITPVKLYLIVSAVFFFLAWDAMLQIQNFEQQFRYNPSLQAVPRPEGIELGIFFQQWVEKSGDYSALTRFASVIGLGLLLAVLYYGARKYYVEHLIFAFHYYAFDFCFFTLIVLLLKILSFITNTRALEWTLYVGYIALLLYGFVALKRVYKESALKTSIKAFMLLLGDMVLTSVGTLIAMAAAYVVVYFSFRP